MGIWQAKPLENKNPPISIPLQANGRHLAVSIYPQNLDSWEEKTPFSDDVIGFKNALPLVSFEFLFSNRRADHECIGFGAEFACLDSWEVLCLDSGI